MVGGVSPGKGGREHLGLPVFNSVQEVSDIKSLTLGLTNRGLYVLGDFSRYYTKLGGEVSYSERWKLPINELLNYFRL